MFTVFGNPYIMDFYFHKNEMFYCVLQFVQKKLLDRMWCRRSCEANKYHQKTELAAFFHKNRTQGAIFSKKLDM